MEEEEVKKLLADVAEKNGKAIADAVTKAVETATKGFLTQEGFADALKAAGIEKETIEKLEKALKEQGVAMKSFQVNIGGAKKDGINGSWKADAVKSIGDSEVQKAIANLARTKSGVVELYSSHEDAEKAVGNITTASVTTTTGGNAILDTINADEINGINLQTPFVEQFSTVSRTSKPVFVYTDYIPKEGDVGFIAETAAKTELDLKLETRYVTPKKAAGYEILSTEAIQDVPRMQSEATGMLFKKYLLKRQNGILFGDGTGDTPTGVTSLARAYDPASWDATNKVQDPNLYDAVIAAATQILTTHNYTDEAEFYPNVAFVNPAIINSLKLKKNEFGMYLFPTFQINGGQGTMNVDNFVLVGKREIPAAKILIGDFTKLRIINYIDYAVTMGWINDQFIKNMFTMVGEGRFMTLIKNLDRNAFIYDDISAIISGITA